MQTNSKLNKKKRMITYTKYSRIVFAAFLNPDFFQASVLYVIQW